MAAVGALDLAGAALRTHRAGLETGRRAARDAAREAHPITRQGEVEAARAAVILVGAAAGLAVGPRGVTGPAALPLVGRAQGRGLAGHAHGQTSAVAERLSGRAVRARPAAVVQEHPGEHGRIGGRPQRTELDLGPRRRAIRVRRHTRAGHAGHRIQAGGAGQPLGAVRVGERALAAEAGLADQRRAVLGAGRLAADEAEHDRQQVREAADLAAKRRLTRRGGGHGLVVARVARRVEQEQRGLGGQPARDVRGVDGQGDPHRPQERQARGLQAQAPAHGRRVRRQHRRGLGEHTQRLDVVERARRDLEPEPGPLEHAALGPDRRLGQGTPGQRGVRRGAAGQGGRRPRARHPRRRPARRCRCRRSHLTRPARRPAPRSRPCHPPRRRPRRPTA